MTPLDMRSFLEPASWYAGRSGPRYAQLARHLSDAIRDGRLPADSQLPPEREMAELSGLSRVTIRKSMELLVDEGVVEQRQGAGSFVQRAPETPQLDHPLSTMTSFTEYMEQRGLTSSSEILEYGLFAPTPEEMIALGLSGNDRASRIRRLRSANDAPLAIETSSLPPDILPDPGLVSQSLYALLRQSGKAPVRAIQRISAVNAPPDIAALLKLPEGTAVLEIERTGYMENRRPIELTRGHYRSDVYNFIAELRLSEAQA